MPQFIPEDKVLEVQQSTDIVELISECLPLKRAGANYKALCPFHDEKTPSFMVSPSKQIYHCFGCHKGGNIFTFLMAFEKVDFPQAVRMLAERRGIKIEFAQQTGRYTQEKRAELLKINRSIADYYHHNLLESKPAEIARGYLKKRGFNQGSIARFLLGYAPAGWEGVVNYAKAKGFPAEYLEELGLILRRKDGRGFYDRFRNRLVFPIFNTRDRVLGFGGRVLDDAEPVYLNSPESSLFSKGKTLYALNFAKDAAYKAGKLCIVEGYTDAIIAHQSGFEWVVATLGTALTPEHIKSIRRFVNKVIVVYDADVAGEMASARTLDLFLTEEIDLYVARLPRGLDPYDCLIQKGSQVFAKCLDEAKDLFSYRLELARARYDLTKIEDKTRAIDEMLGSVIAIPNVIRRNLEIKRLGEELGVSESILRDRLKYKVSHGRREPESLKPTNLLSHLNQRDIRAGEDIIEILLRENNLIPAARQSIAPEDFPSPESHKIIQEIFRIYDRYGKVSVDMLLALISNEPKLANQVVNIIERSSTKGKQDYQKYLEESLGYLSKRRRETREKPSLRHKLKEAQLKGDKKELDRLLSEFEQLKKLSHQVSVNLK